MQLTVANSYRFGGVVENTEPRIDDGMLDLYSIELRRWWDPLEILGAVAVKRFPGCKRRADDPRPALRGARTTPPSRLRRRRTGDANSGGVHGGPARDFGFRTQDLNRRRWWWPTSYAPSLGAIDIELLTPNGFTGVTSTSTTRSWPIATSRWASVTRARWCLPCATAACASDGHQIAARRGPAR
jgi:hypothetical protein